MNEFIPSNPAEKPAESTGWENMAPKEPGVEENQSLTFPEGVGNDAYALEGRGSLGDEIAAAAEAPEEPAAQAVFSAEAPVAETATIETPATETAFEGTTVSEAAPAESADPIVFPEGVGQKVVDVPEQAPATDQSLTFPEGVGIDAYELEGRGSLGDEIRAAKASETVPENITATPEAEEQKENIKQAIAEIRSKLDQIEAAL